MSKTIAIVPARMGSSRFPGKPLALIKGKPMIGHVLDRLKECQEITDLYLATCDQEIFDYGKSIGHQVIMTKDTHERCTDRACEAVEKIEQEKNCRYEFVIIVQGDEPLVTPKSVDLAISTLKHDPKIQVANLMGPLKSHHEFQNPNEIKVVTDRENNALYFSRSAIPFSQPKREKQSLWQKQICIMPFRRDFLFEFSNLPEGELEKSESIDMLRILEHGGKVKMIPTEEMLYSVDTPEDLKFVETLL